MFKGIWPMYLENAHPGFNSNREQTPMKRVMTEVPPFPAVAIKALQTISNKNSQIRELGELIAADAAFASEILRMANSALFGGRAEVSSILQAILLLGLERVKGVVATLAMKAYMGDALEIPALRACWRHSLACAVIAEELARLSLMEPDVAYTAGLMHDIGRLALVVAHPKKYADFLTTTEVDPYNALQRERDLFGVDHCEAGRELIIRWNLPKMFIAVTAQHHDPEADGEPAALWTVSHSCVIADALGFNVLHPIQPRKYENILMEFPERDRERFPRDPSELTLYIANKINSIECA
jgi:putative nucleotidyltransferase with HDIG domain